MKGVSIDLGSATFPGQLNLSPDPLYIRKEQTAFSKPWRRDATRARIIRFSLNLDILRRPARY